MEEFEVGKKYKHIKDSWEGIYLGPGTIEITKGLNMKGQLMHQLEPAHRMNVTKPTEDKNMPMSTVGEWTGQFQRNWFEEIREEKVVSLGPQEPPQDERIFNRTRPDGSRRPVSEYFERVGKKGNDKTDYER